MPKMSEIPKIIESGGEEYSYVVAGAILKCSYRSKRNRLKTPFSHGVYIKGKAQLNIMDYKPNINFMPFGTCNKPGCTQVPCEPVVTIPWINGKDNKLVEKQPALLNISTNMCIHGGRIAIEDDGQDGLTNTGNKSNRQAGLADTANKSDGQTRETNKWPLVASLSNDFLGDTSGIPTIGPDPDAAIREQAVIDARMMLDSILKNNEYYFWVGEYYLAENSVAYAYFQKLKMEVQNYKFTDGMLESLVGTTRFADSYKTVSAYEPIPTPFHVAAAAFLTVGKYGTLHDGTAGLATPVEFLKKNHEKSKGVATALAKFNYIMSSDYRYLMISGYGSRAMMEELNKLKTQTQQREFRRYNSIGENAVYKDEMLRYIDKIYKMNENHDYELTWLKNNLKLVEKEVSQIDVEKINKKL